MRNLEIPWSSRWITPDSEFDLRETSSLVRSESESGSEKDDDDAIDDREDTRSRRDKSFLLIAIVFVQGEFGFGRERRKVKDEVLPFTREPLVGEEGLRSSSFCHLAGYPRWMVFIG